MKFVTTGDHSVTLYNEDVGDHYHSTSGAIEESFQKFAIPALEGKHGQKSVWILDICFGLGYNSLAAMHYLHQNNPNIDIWIVGLERDRAVLSASLTVPMVPLLREEYALVQEAARKASRRKRAVVEDEHVCIKLLVGDARESIHGLTRSFDVVFLDPFAPQKDPLLWQEAFMHDIYTVMKPGAVLTTYSCAGMVRRNLTAAGFTVSDGPRVGRRAPSTIAVKPASRRGKA
ncbi:MAG: MnmC family methyltransferase [Nanoarchaeota archaeon]